MFRQISRAEETFSVSDFDITTAVSRPTRSRLVSPDTKHYAQTSCYKLLLDFLIPKAVDQKYLQ